MKLISYLSLSTRLHGRKFKFLDAVINGRNMCATSLNTEKSMGAQKSCKIQSKLNFDTANDSLARLSLKDEHDKNIVDETKATVKGSTTQAICKKQKSKDESTGEIVNGIPSIVSTPELRRVADDLAGVTKVMIDLETTSCAADTEICQIAATDGSREFNVYVLPRGDITAGATRVNKLRKKGGALYHEQERVDAVRLDDGLRKLLDWLKYRTPCLLVAHNAKVFDSRHLVKAFVDSKEMSEFSRYVLGFSDSLTAFRERFPERKCYKQPALAQDLLKETYNAHNALDDVRMLNKLVSRYISDDLLVAHSFTLASYRRYLAHAQMKQGNLRSLKPLIDAGKLSNHMATKVAESGLGMNHLEFAYQTGGDEYLENVLKQPDHEGKARVTKDKKVLEKVCSYFD